MTKSRFKISMRPLMLAAAALLWCAGSASAVTIFSDNFTDGNLVGWSTSGGGGSVSNIFVGAPHGRVMALRGSGSHAFGTVETPQATAGSNFNTSAYTGLQLSFDRYSINTEPTGTGTSDSLIVEWSVTGSGIWNNIVTYIGDTTDANVAFNIAAALGSDIDIRFRANLTKSDEYYKIDNVLLTGNLSAVPLPPAVLLFGTALVGLGLLGRRRKKDAVAQA